MFAAAVKIVNFTKEKPLNLRTYNASISHTRFLPYPEVRCLTRGRVLVCIFSESSEVFITQPNLHDVCVSRDWHTQPTYFKRWTSPTFISRQDQRKWKHFRRRTCVEKNVRGSFPTLNDNAIKLRCKWFFEHNRTFCVQIYIYIWRIFGK
jgi:hypothetical protein